MPLIAFVCPDSEKILITDCLSEGGCRLGNRCATRSYLRLISQERPWTGRPSTTQLIGGTMFAFLKLTKDYAVSPDARAFMVNGIRAHNNLEGADDGYSFLEERFDCADTEITGIADVVEVENGKTILADYKTSGSYKVSKALGFYVDIEETDEVFKSGRRKGQKKARRILKQADNKIDRHEWELQLGKYALELAKRGFPVDEIKIQCIVRDGGTYVARSRGVFRNLYYFKINRLPDKEINEYFERKKNALLMALKCGKQDEICTAAENWDSLRCQNYCEVAEFCKYGKYLKKVEPENGESSNGRTAVFETANEGSTPSLPAKNAVASRLKREVGSSKRLRVPDTLR